jgi:predicted secreted protein
MVKWLISRSIVLLAFVMFVIVHAQAQSMSGPISSETSTTITGIQKWEGTFGGSQDDGAKSVQQTNDEGYVIAGWTNSYGNGGWDVWLIKTNSSGSKEWDRTFGGPNDDYANSVQQTNDGGYIIAGWTRSIGASGQDAWLIKTDPMGNKEWDKTFGGEYFIDEIYSVQQTRDDGYIIAGRTDRVPTNNCDVWLIKTDVNGNILWDKTFGKLDNDEGYSVQQTSDDGYIVTGRTGSYGSGDSDAYPISGEDVWLIKTDAQGNELWNKTFGQPPWDEGHSVQQTSDGGYVIAGYTGSNSAGVSDVWMVKTDADGNLLWDRTFGGSNGDRANSVQQTSDGGYILAGWTASYGAGGKDAWLIKTDPSGNKEWERTFGMSNDDEANSVQQTTDGGYIIAGDTTSYGFGGVDVWLIKTDANGNTGEFLLKFVMS